MKFTVDKVPVICPRCNDNFIPNNETPGAYIGALSRADNKTEICSQCGEEEAMEDYISGHCQPVCIWPVKRS
jgi:hypothetical protein